MRGTIIKIKPVIKNQHLRIIAKIKTEEKSLISAYLPDREVSAILPRNILAGRVKKVPRSLLKTISPIIKRISCRRQVRVWEYNNIYYFSFLSWKNIVFISGLNSDLKQDMSAIST